MTETCKHGRTEECVKCADAARKRKSRAKVAVEKAAAAAQAEVNAAVGLKDFWALALTGANPEKLARWRARQEDVEAILSDIQTALEGRQPDEEFVEDVDKEIREDIRVHGVANVTGPLLLDKFWSNPELLAKFTGGPDTPSTIFARFGVLVAIDDYTLHKWSEFIQRHRASRLPAVPMTAAYTLLTCTGCNAPPESVSVQVAEAYRRTNSFLCGTCLEKRSKAREFSQAQRSEENVIRDDWGRVRE